MLTFMYSDGAVVRKVLQGNQGVFRVLVERYAGVVHSVAYAHLRDSNDAEDITQETFTRFYQQLDRLAHYTQVGPWLVSVARNASVDLLRKRGHESAMVKSAGRAGATEQNPGREELHRILREQLEALNGEAREVLILHYFMHKKAREIGALLGITPETATKRVQRAREELGRRLADLLGEEIADVRPDAHRSERIMAAVCAMPMAWKASAAGASAAMTAVGVATGAVAAKLGLGAGVIAVAAIVALLAHDRSAPAPSVPHDTASAITTEAPDAQEASTGAPEAPASQGAANAPVTEEEQDTDDVGAATRGRGASGFPVILGTLRGTVTLEDGAPAPGATVTLDNDTWVKEADKLAKFLGSVKPLDPVTFSVVADSAGQYEIGDVAFTTSGGGTARYRLSARLQGLYDEMTWFELSLQEPENTYDLVLRPDFSIGGIVLDSQGRPVKEVIVSSRDQPTPTGFLMRRTETGENGRFLLEHMRSDPTRLDAYKRGYLTLNTEPLTIGTTNNVLRMDSGTSISGRVIRKEDGTPVADILVLGQCEGGANMFGITIVQDETDEQGNFTLTGCIPGSFTLEAFPKDANPMPLTLSEPVTVKMATSPVRGVEMKLVAGATVRGRVIDDETGHVARGNGYVNALTDGKLFCRRGTVGEDGSYELLGLPSGTLSLQAYFYPGQIPEKRDAGSLTIAESEKSKSHDIHLAKRPFIAGTVVDEEGAPVGGASVYAVHAETFSNLCSAVSDTSGKFLLALPDYALSPSGMFVQARNKAGFSSPEGPYNPAAYKSDVLLRLVSQGRLEGELVDQQGRPVDQAMVQAVSDNSDNVALFESKYHIFVRGDRMNVVNMRVQPDGSFQSPLLPGKYTLEAHVFSSPPGSPTATRTVTVEPGRTVRSQLVADNTECGSIEGAVALGGQPVLGAFIVVEPVAADWSHQVRVDVPPSGQYEAHNLAAGQVEVVLRAFPGPNKELEKRQTAEVVAGEVTRVDFEIAGGQAAAEGYVSYNGAPAEYAEIAFHPVDSEDAGQPRARTDQSGYYKSEGLPEGAYRVEAAKVTNSGWAPMRLAQTVEAQLTANQTTRIDIELVGGEIAGTVSGLKTGERAFIALFPGDAVLTAWTVEALETLGERLLASTIVERDGPFTFSGLQEGHYVVAALALGVDVPAQIEAFVNAPVAIGDVVVTIGATAEVGLELPAH